VSKRTEAQWTRREAKGLADALKQRVQPKGEAEFNKRFPHNQDLLVLWLVTHFKDRPCVVFCDPLKHFDNIRHHFPGEGTNTRSAWGGICAILVCRTVLAATTIMYATPDSKPFTMVWSGRRILGTNS